MKIRTVERLYDVLSRDLAWRKKELTSYRIAVETSRAFTERRDAFLRGALAILYAHWEGYVKAAAASYLEFIASQRLRNSELSLPILAVSIRPLLRRASHTDRIRHHLEVADFLINQQGNRSTIPYKGTISARGNLSSRMLREIIETLGLDYTPFATKEALIDEALLERRNTIAHGEYLPLSLEHYVDVSEKVLSMLEEVTTQITNAAVLGLYRRAS
jgi:hypothetical protein